MRVGVLGLEVGVLGLLVVVVLVLGREGVVGLLGVLLAAAAAEEADVDLGVATFLGVFFWGEGFVFVFAVAGRRKKSSCHYWVLEKPYLEL